MLSSSSFVVLFLLPCSAYKFLVYSPIFGYSHTHFMGAIADTLTEAGHNVTVLMPVMDIEQKDKTSLKLTKNVIKTPADQSAIEFSRHEKEELGSMWTMKPDVLGMTQMVQNMTKVFSAQCKKVISDKSLMRRLKEEQFDVGISEVFAICGLGVIKAANIRAWISVFSGPQVASLSGAIGEPSIPSYVPGLMSTYGDEMNIWARFVNAVGSVLEENFFATIYKEEMKILRSVLGSGFDDWRELIAESSFVVTNSNPYLDYPRPMLYKTIPIGGIAVSFDVAENKLSKEWDYILSERNHTVLVSFGSVAKAIFMPDLYKETLLSVFGSMPDTTFILKYEEPGSKLAAHLNNVYLSTWVPQNALLADPRLTAFVTHGGLGSTMELAHQGKPAILIPLFGDQSRNAHMLARHGGGIVLTKYDLKNPKKLVEALRTIISDRRYSENAKRLSEMLLNQPISAKQLLVRHCEYAARFGRLPNLDPYGRQLSFMQYYLLDVILLAINVFLIAVYIIFLLLSRCFSFAVKIKKD